MNYKNIIATAVLLTVIGVFSVVWQKADTAQGGVFIGSSYQSTTTPQVADETNLCPARVGMASSTTGVLGNVNVLNANVSAFTIYDATTTDTTKRGNTATSSLILAEFPASPTEGSYSFDIGFKRGLLIDYADINTTSTTTIGYDCQG